MSSCHLRIRIIGLLVAMLSAQIVAPASNASPLKLKVVHSFCSKADCTDGYDLYGGLTADAAGNLYGTTAQGGAHDLGTVFELIKEVGGHWKHKTLYSFCARDNCTDGRDPIAAPTIDVSGNLIGTTFEGGLEDDYPDISAMASCTN